MLGAERTWVFEQRVVLAFETVVHPSVLSRTWDSAARGSETRGSGSIRRGRTSSSVLTFHSRFRGIVGRRRVEARGEEVRRVSGGRALLVLPVPLVFKRHQR